MESNLNELAKYVSTLSPKIQKALVLYTTPEIYKDLNRKIRNDEPLDDFDLKIIRRIDFAFRYAPLLTATIVVYRGVKRFYDPALISYTSTSTNINTALDFTGDDCCFLTITVPSGSNVLPLWAISDYPGDAIERSEVARPQGRGRNTN